MHTTHRLRPTTAALVAAAALLFAACQAQPTGPAQGAANTPAVTAAVQYETGAIPTDSGLRPWAMYRPNDVGVGERLPVLVMLHGMNADRFWMMGVADWQAKVADRRFIAVFPQGQNNAWNAGNCCPPSAGSSDDIGYLNDLLAVLSARPDVDPARISVGGFSNGAMMAYRFACDSTHPLAAVVAVAGSKMSDCVPGAAVPTLHLHGASDDVVSYDGSPTVAGVVLGRTWPNVDAMVANYADSNGLCDNSATRTPATQLADRVTEYRYDCGGVDTVLHRIDGLTHVWPDIVGYSGTDTVLEFTVGR